MKKFALIVGGGQGLRFGGDIPKQFQLLNNRPVLFRSIDLFLDHVDHIVVVIPQHQFDYYRSLLQSHPIETDPSRLVLVAGGQTRTESVRNGLSALPEDGIVAIHDAVRPLASENLIGRLFSACMIHGSAIPVVPVRDSLRQKSEQSTRAVNREEFVCVQTPQCFRLATLKEAYQTHHDGLFSDDASLWEESGKGIHTVEGDSSNIKITWSEDLLFAEAILKTRNT